MQHARRLMRQFGNAGIVTISLCGWNSQLPLQRVTYRGEQLSYGRYDTPSGRPGPVSWSGRR
jgi:hypothetical protein